MKLNVQGIEEIEITDPAGLCNPPVPQRGQPVPQLPSPPIGIYPTPQIPTPISPFRPQPAPPIYTRKTGDPFAGEPNWGVGGPMIQQAGQQVDKDKWQKGWQSKVTGEDTDNGNRSTQ